MPMASRLVFREYRPTKLCFPKYSYYELYGLTSEGDPLWWAHSVGDEELDNGTLSENEVVRNLRKPALDKKQVVELVEASIDRRYYFVNVSRLDKNVIVHWYGSQRRRFHKEYKAAVRRVRELAHVNFLFILEIS